jgi:hypothetical protein
MGPRRIRRVHWSTLIRQGNHSFNLGGLRAGKLRAISPINAKREAIINRQSNLTEPSIMTPPLGRELECDSCSDNNGVPEA